MIRARIELVPFGNEELVREIGQITICNEGPHGHHSDEAGWHNYSFEVRGHGDSRPHRGHVTHRRSDGSWRLLQRVLDIHDLEDGSPW